MSSCGKDSVKTSYMVSFGWTDITQSRDIPDVEIREKYEQIISDIYNLKSTTDAILQKYSFELKYN